ncbi:MAG TPA: zf-HC2 domain-containing protein [Terriglobales bacterium]|nr:zf-HC2 domain-containing protein [Terriglobales bacterium]
MTTMEHLSEERLVAHHYGDESARERAQAEQHLAACPDCARQMAELASLLGAVQAPEEPARSESYGTEVWNRIRAHLPEQPERRSWFGWPQRWAVAGAVAVLVVAAFLVGRYVQSPTPGPNVAQQPAPEKVRERVLLVALGDHLEKSQMVLIEIANAPTTGPLDISAEQQRAEDLVDASRLYRQAAQSNGDANTAKVLDELERTLLDIAHSPSQLDQGELKRIQQRIESQGLIFKVRVIGAKVKQEQRPQKDPGMKNESNPQSQSRKQI